MNEHPSDQLLAVAEGAVPSPAVAAHLDHCDRCSRTLDALAPVDLAGIYTGVLAELDAPAPGLLERVAVRLGLDPALARLPGTTPTLSPGWLLASGLVLGLGMLLASSAATGFTPALVVAPLVAASAVAFAFGPGVDPAYDIVSVTPMSPLRALLVRLAAVLAVNAALVTVVDLALGGSPFGMSWLLPMTGAALLAAVVAARFSPIVGAVAGMGAWLTVLAVLAANFRSPLAVLTGAAAQLAAAAVVGVLLAILLRSAVVATPARRGPQAS